MAVYTVIGWYRASETLDIGYFDAPGVFDAVRAAFGVRLGQRSDWQFVVAYGGKLRPAVIDGGGGRPGPRRAADFTVVGFWAFSGETLSRSCAAGTAAEAMRLIQGRTAGEDELRLVAVMPGRLAALVTAENLPPF